MRLEAARAVRTSDLSTLGATVTRALSQRLFTYLGGLDVRDWVRLLRSNRFSVDPMYRPRAAWITYASVRTTLERATEQRLFGPAVVAVRVERPVFILGHARSGTTHLHRLIALDDRFAWPNVYQVNHPHSFLSTERRHAGRVGAVLPTTRLMDGMSYAVDGPEEDEFALTLLTRCSPFLGSVFPRHADRYQRYLTLRDVAADDLSRWKAALVWFAKKLTYKYGRPLLIKSPWHTARVRLLLDLFPEARFIHIRRHPYAVFASNRAKELRLEHTNRLQRSCKGRIEQGIIQTYRETYEAFFTDRALIRPDRLFELRFEDLEQDPIGQVRELYRQLDFPWTARLESKLDTYVRSLQGYRKNVHPTLPPPVRERVANAWHRSFQEWRYDA